MANKLVYNTIIFYEKKVSELENEPGVYIVQLIDDKNTKNLPIVRFNDTDKKGIFCIGKADDLKDRLKRFENAREKGKAKHSEGCRLHEIEKDLKKGTFNIRFMVYPCKADENNRDLEDELLKKYFDDFWELPPLNRMGPRKKKNEKKKRK